MGAVSKPPDADTMAKMAATNPKAAQQMQAMQAMQASGPIVYARNFAVMTGVHSGVSHLLLKVRGKEDLQGRYALFSIKDVCCYITIHSSFVIQNRVLFCLSWKLGSPVMSPLTFHLPVCGDASCDTLLAHAPPPTPTPTNQPTKKKYGRVVLLRIRFRPRIRCWCSGSAGRYELLFLACNLQAHAKSMPPFFVD